MSESTLNCASISSRFWKLWPNHAGTVLSSPAVWVRSNKLMASSSLLISSIKLHSRSNQVSNVHLVVSRRRIKWLIDWLAGFLLHNVTLCHIIVATSIPTNLKCTLSCFLTQMLQSVQMSLQVAEIQNVLHIKDLDCFVQAGLTGAQNPRFRPWKSLKSS